MGLAFLTEEETEAIWRAFGPGTVAGREIRRLFAPSHKQVGSKIDYPRIKRKDGNVSRNEPEQESKSVKIRYPRFARSERAGSEPLSKGRKSFHEIQKELLNFEIVRPSLASKDLSTEKVRLQESFQFSHAKVLPPSVAGDGSVKEPTGEEVAEFRDSRKRTTGTAQLVNEIASDINEWEKECADQNQNYYSRRNIQGAYKDLQLLTCLL